MLPQRILCPIDFSDGSRSALRAAVDLAKVSSGEITLLHTFPPPRVGNDAMSEIVRGEALAELEAQTQRALAEWRDEALALGAKKVETVALAGTPSEQIVKLAEKEEAQVIVMGTHGRTGIERALLGSVTEKVVRHAPCGVFVVRPQA